MIPNCPKVKRGRRKRASDEGCCLQCARCKRRLKMREHADRKRAGKLMPNGRPRICDCGQCKTCIRRKYYPPKRGEQFDEDRMNAYFEKVRTYA